MINIGDFVTQYSAGYWQVIDIKVKIASDDYTSSDGRIKWRKGDNIGWWVLMKKAFTPKMKPRIDFECVDSAWVRPVSAEVLCEIEKFFEENPDYKVKFDNAPPKFRPTVTNCWLDLPSEDEEKFREMMSSLPAEFTMDEFWRIFKKYKKYISKPHTRYLLNFLTHDWMLDKKCNRIYFACELVKS